MNGDLGSAASSKTPWIRDKYPLEPIKFLEGNKELQNFPYDLRKQLEAYCQRHHRRDLYGAVKKNGSGDLYLTRGGRKARFIHPERHDEELLAARFSYGTSAIITVVQQKTGNDLNDGRPAVVYSGGGGGKTMLWGNKLSQAFRYTIWDVSERGYNGLDFVFRQVNYSDKFKDPTLNGSRPKGSTEEANGSPLRENSHRRHRATGDSDSSIGNPITSVSNTPRSRRPLHNQAITIKENAQQDPDTITPNQSTPNVGNGFAKPEVVSKDDVRTNTGSVQNSLNAGHKRRRSIAAEEVKLPKDALQELLELPIKSKRLKRTHDDMNGNGVVGANPSQNIPLTAEVTSNIRNHQANGEAHTEQVGVAHLPLIEEPVHLNAMHSPREKTIAEDKNAQESQHMSISVVPEGIRPKNETINFIFKKSNDDNIPYQRSIKQGDITKSLFTIARITKGANPVKPLWIIIDDTKNPIPITQDDEQLLQDILDAFRFVGKSNVIVLANFEDNDAQSA